MQGNKASLLRKFLRHFLIFSLHFVKKKMLKCQSIQGATHWSGAKGHKSMGALPWACRFTPAEIEASSGDAPVMLCCPTSAASRIAQTCRSYRDLWDAMSLPYNDPIDAARPLGKLALKVCASLIPRGILHTEEGMVKAARRDAGCEIRYCETKHITER